MQHRARDLLWYKTHLWQPRASFRSDVNHPEPPNPGGGMLVATPGASLGGPCTAADLDLHGDTPAQGRARAGEGRQGRGMAGGVKLAM